MNQIYALNSRSVISVSGSDRIKFLQGLITNDVNLLAKESCIYSLMLTPNGRYLYDFFLWSEGDSILLDVEQQFAEAILKKLNLYKLRSDVSLKLETETQVYAVDEGGVKDPRLDALGHRLIAKKTIADAGPEEEFIKNCWELGVPYHSRDMIPEKSIPLEWNMDAFHAIAWNKGCYMGQELTARTKHQGIVRKIACPIEIKGKTEVGDELILKDQKVGKLQNNHDGFGFALIEIEVLRQGALKFMTASHANIRAKIPSWLKNIISTST